MTTLLTIVDRAGDNLFHLETFVAREMNTPAAADAPNGADARRRRRLRATGLPSLRPLGGVQ